MINNDERRRLLHARSVLMVLASGAISYDSSLPSKISDMLYNDLLLDIPKDTIVSSFEPTF